MQIAQIAQWCSWIVMAHGEAAAHCPGLVPVSCGGSSECLGGAVATNPCQAHNTVVSCQGLSCDQICKPFPLHFLLSVRFCHHFHRKMEEPVQRNLTFLLKDPFDFGSHAHNHTCTHHCTRAHHFLWAHPCNGLTIALALTAAVWRHRKPVWG